MGFRGGFIRSSIAPLLAPSLVCARSGLRLARVFALAPAALLFVALPQAASASLSWSGPITIDPGGGGYAGHYTLLSGVACPSTVQCTAVDARGQELTFDPASPGTPKPTTIDGISYLTAVACPSTSQCTAVDDFGYQVTFDPSSPGTPTRTVLDENGDNEYGGEDLTAVACPSVALCVVVGRGEVFVGQESVVAPPASTPANSSPPVISGTVKVGQTLSASTGTWSGTAPISYSYRWARCSSSCSAISGAAASSYTLTSGDVGQKISVVVTATNTAGSAQAGAAEVGPVVASPSGPSSAEVKATLSKVLKPSGKTATTKAIIKSGGFSFSFSVPSAGKLVIDWYYLPSGAKLAKKAKQRPVLVGAGQRTFSAAGTAMIKIKLTAAGKSLLKHATQVKLTAKGTFTPTGKTAITATRTFVLKR